MYRIRCARRWLAPLIWAFIEQAVVRFAQSLEATRAAVAASTVGSEFAPILLASTVALFGFGYLLVLGRIFGLEGARLDLALYLAGTSALPIAAAGLLVRLYPREPRTEEAGLLETVQVLVASAGLVLLASGPVAMHLLGGGEDFWRAVAWPLLVLVLCVHAALVVTAVLTPERLSRALSRRPLLRSRTLQFAAFTLSFGLSMTFLFRIEPAAATFNMLFAYFFERVLDPGMSVLWAWLATGFAALVLVGVVQLHRWEARVSDPRARVVRARPFVLLAVLVLVGVHYFDFALVTDPLHFLTNLAPALHILHGGRFMVDAFSQYGPGPLLATLGGAVAIGPTFPVASVVTQIHNLLLYATILACMYRMAGSKYATLAIGFLAIGILLSGWWGGKYNLNSVPSAMGLRYLPAALMVLSISVLPGGARHSALTLSAATLAGMWSWETAVGTLAIYLGFLVMLDLYERRYLRLVTDSLIAAAALLGGVALLAVGTRAATGEFPDFRTYLRFVSQYNMLSAYWSIPSTGLFWGWVPVFLPVFVVLSFAWARIFQPASPAAPLASGNLYYRYVPMAMLAGYMASYFVGRSVGFTLIIAFLPFTALVASAMLGFIDRLWREPRPLRLLCLVPAAAFVWAVSFSTLAVYRDSSPYTLLFHQCAYRGNCSASGLRRDLSSALDKKPGIEPAYPGWNDPERIMAEAIDLMELWAPGAEHVAVFLGSYAGMHLANDLALLYSGRWHRWPISYTFTDQLLDSRVESIAAAPIELREGEIVIIRRDESALGPLERAILEQIRSRAVLCPVGSGSTIHEVYRVRRSGPCLSTR